MAEEKAAKEENLAAARSIARKLMEERKAIAELVAQLRAYAYWLLDFSTQGARHRRDPGRLNDVACQPTPLN